MFCSNLHVNEYICRYILINISLHQLSWLRSNEEKNIIRNNWTHIYKFCYKIKFLRFIFKIVRKIQFKNERTLAFCTYQVHSELNKTDEVEILLHCDLSWQCDLNSWLKLLSFSGSFIPVIRSEGKLDMSLGKCYK